MVDMLIRWTFGESQEKPVHPQAYSMLLASLRSAHYLYPKAQRVICHNHFYSPDSYTKLRDVARLARVQMVDVRDLLHYSLRKFDTENAWWKFAPVRLAPNAYELIMDNDVVLWRKPPAIESWLNEGGMLASGNFSRYRLHNDYSQAATEYGIYLREVLKLNKLTNLNSGVIGWAPGVNPTIPLAEARLDPFNFCNEQGFYVLNYLKYPGPRHLISFKSVATVGSDRLELLKFDGAHFYQHNTGKRTHWSDVYQAEVSSYLHLLEKGVAL